MAHQADGWSSPLCLWLTSDVRRQNRSRPARRSERNCAGRDPASWPDHCLPGGGFVHRVWLGDGPGTGNIRPSDGLALRQFYRGRIRPTAFRGANAPPGDLVQRSAVTHREREPLAIRQYVAIGRPDAESVSQPDHLLEPTPDPEHESFSQPQPESVQVQLAQPVA